MQYWLLMLVAYHGLELLVVLSYLSALGAADGYLIRHD
jgi:hypothetical protein